MVIFRHLLVTKGNEVGIFVINNFADPFFLPLIAPFAKPTEYSPQIFEDNAINSINIDKLFELSVLKPVKVQIAEQEVRIGLGELSQLLE